ncbi:hypothetical protein ILUMI_12190 [Ignelater luminosus]|uniref:SURP motif domain-containing protein n=1 Tax=Ignelater luminosus TaxID=2038154 RepID=A0A8K0G9S6_IGNLU|nr:hypothetical protein ILUMI_12190 [Ignelater luminosus]
MPTVTYKPSADCTYSQLVNRIQGTQSESATPPQPLPEVTQTPVIYEQQQYYQQYYYAAQYYEYYKQMAQQFQGQPPDKLPQDGSAFAQTEIFTANQNTSIPNPLNMQNILQSQAAYMQYLQQQSIANPYAQIVSNLSHNKDLSPAYSNFVQTDPNQTMIQNSDITKAPILYGQNEQHMNIQNIPSQNFNVQPELANQTHLLQNVNVQDNIKDKERSSEGNQSSAKKPPLLSIAQYGSDTENENSSEDEEAVKIPPGEMQQIIDKMASYVLKNGKDFENIVKSKGDPRFEFLNENHEYHPYYVLKTKESTEKLSNNNKPEEDKEVKDLYNGNVGKLKEKKIITPVSFSIKKPKDEVPKEIKSALPVEESDDDHEDSTAAKTPPTLPVTVISDLPSTCSCYTTVTVTVSNTSPPSLSSTSSIITSARSVNKTPPLKEPSTVSVTTDTELSRLQENEHENKDENASKLEETEKIKSSVDSDDLILEMIDLTDDLEEKREMKRAEDRKKDKIAAAAREKLALQLERKKKAAAFLKLKSVETVSNSDKSKSESRNEKSSKKKSDKNKDDLELSIKHSNYKKSKSSKTKDKNEEEILKVDDSESEEGEIKKHKKQSKKKRSHKRKHSRSRHESKSRHKSKEHKKSKKRRRRSESNSSNSSTSSQ